MVTTGAIRRAKLQSHHHHQQTNIQFFTGRMSFLSPNQQCQGTEGKNITFHGLAYPKLTWGLPTLSLTGNSSWLPWGRVSMPLISPLMPVPRPTTLKITEIKKRKEQTDILLFLVFNNTHANSSTGYNVSQRFNVNFDLNVFLCVQYIWCIPETS